MTDEKQDMYKQLNSLFEEHKLNIPDIIMSPRWRDTMQNKRYFTGANIAKEDSDKTVIGMNVHYSNFVEDDAVYLVSNPRRFSTIELPEIDKITHTRIQDSLEKIIYRSMGIPVSLFQDDWKRETKYNWHQFPDETILEWGDRLFAKGLLDNPEIRWEYQKTVLGAPFNKLKALWLEFKS